MALSTFNNIQDLTGGLCAMWEQCWTTVSISSFNAGDEISATINGTRAPYRRGGRGHNPSAVQPSGIRCRNGTYRCRRYCSGLIDGGGDSDTVDLTAPATGGGTPDAAFSIARQNMRANGQWRPLVGGGNTWIVDGAPTRSSVAKLRSPGSGLQRSVDRSR